MKKIRSKTMSTFIALVLVSILLIGCGNSGSSSSEDTSTDATQTSSDSDSQEDYSSKIVTYGLTSAWESLNPYVTTSAYSALVQDKIYDKLFFIEEGGSDISPRNAESWEVDGNTVTIHLNEDATWHDGEPVTANDWVYTLQLITNADVETISRSSYNVFEGTDDDGVAAVADELGVTATDDYTLVMTLKSDYTEDSFADLVVNNFKQLLVLPEHILGEDAPADVFADDYFSAPVGSGPAIFESEIIGNTLTLDTNQDYYLGAPKFGKLVMMVVSSSNVVTSVEAGELDYSFAFLSVDDYLSAEDEGLNVMVSDTANKINMIMINNETITDSRIREAMQYAINKESMVENVLLDNAVVTSSMFVPDSKYLDTDLPTERDVDKAKELLEEANYDSSTEYTLEVPSGYRVQLANMIQQDLAEVGITINIVTTDASTMFADAESGDCDLMIMADATPDSILAGDWYYTTENYFSHITDTTFDDYMEEFKTVTDEDELMELATEWQEYCFEQSPIIPLFYQYNFALVSDKITEINPFDTQMFNDAIWEWEIN